MPKHFYEALKIAHEHRFPCPDGFALVCCNRIRNGQLKPSEDGTRDFLGAMATTDLDTAKRWLAHWERGGSIRSISRTTEEQAVRWAKEDKAKAERKRRNDD